MKSARPFRSAFVVGLAAATPVASADVITDRNKITADATKVAPALNTNLATCVAAIGAIARGPSLLEGEDGD